MSRSRPITNRALKIEFANEHLGKGRLSNGGPLLKFEMILPTLFSLYLGISFSPTCFDLRVRHTAATQTESDRTHANPRLPTQPSFFVFSFEPAASPSSSHEVRHRKKKQLELSLLKNSTFPILFIEKREFLQCDRAFSHANPYFSPFELSSSSSSPAAGGGGRGGGRGGGGGRSEGRRSGHPLR